jgi:hypothetical protein
MNPAWRDTLTHLIVVSSFPDGSSQSLIDAVYRDITYNKTAALRKLSPDTGAYFNEADSYEVDWQKSFFGENYEKLRRLKENYDPENVLWCRRCVGSEKLVETKDGRLCTVKVGEERQELWWYQMKLFRLFYFSMKMLLEEHKLCVERDTTRPRPFSQSSSSNPAQMFAGYVIPSSLNWVWDASCHTVHPAYGSSSTGILCQTYLVKNLPPTTFSEPLFVMPRATDKYVSPNLPLASLESSLERHSLPCKP